MTVPATSASARTAPPAHLEMKRTLPAVRLSLYYIAIVAIATILIRWVPGFREALVAPIVQAPASEVEELVTGGHPNIPGPSAPWPGVFGRSALALTAAVWALAMSAPVVWVLMRTRRLRYDPSLINTLIVLPIVVAGVVLIVKNSLALAFALAGIVAGVRFRKSLDDPEQAVYVLLALGIGLAAGVQALDIALVMSVAFNFVVLTIWRYDVGGIYARGRGAQLAIGDPALLMHSARSAARKALERDAAQLDGIKPDGMLVIRSRDKDAGRRAIETVVARLASEWHISDPSTDEHGNACVQAFVKMKKGVEPAELVADLESGWSDQLRAAQFVPLSTSTED